MERDFLGVIGKESHAAAAVPKEEGRSNIQDSVYYGNGSAAGIQWPSSSNKSPPPPLPPFMSIKTIRDDKSFDQFSISGFQPKPDNVARTAAAPVIPQQYPVHGYGGPTAQSVNGSRVFPVMSHHHSAPFAPNNPFMKVTNASQNVNSVTPVKQQQYGGGGSGGFNFNGHLVGSTFGVFVPRDVPKPSPTAQMTIFYAGSVCSFDNIPVDKAKEILMLASKAANLPPPTTELPKSNSDPKPNLIDSNNIKTSNPIQQLHKQSPVLAASSPVSIVSRSASSSNNSESNNVTKSLSPLLGPSSQSAEPSSSSLPSKLSNAASSPAAAAAIMPRAVPQARKASLARFLERRKERVTSTPYTKPTETVDACQSTNGLTPKSSNGIINLSTNCDDSLSLGQSNNSSYKNDAPSTELQI